MGLSRTVFEKDGDIVENRKFFPPRAFLYGPADRVPLGIGYWHKGSKTRMMRYQMVEKVLR